jgi:hypothetical protein
VVSETAQGQRLWLTTGAGAGETMALLLVEICPRDVLVEEPIEAPEAGMVVAELVKVFPGRDLPDWAFPETPLPPLKCQLSMVMVVVIEGDVGWPLVEVTTTVDVAGARVVVIVRTDVLEDSWHVSVPCLKSIKVS